MHSITRIQGGNIDGGREVFRRVCSTCHKIGMEGANLGPELTNVGSRLDSYKLVESIVDPNASIDEKYVSTTVITDDGRSITGLLVSETPDDVVIFNGKEKKTIKVAEIEERVKLKQSSMPEGLAATLSPNELLDVIEFLKSRK
jgi:putative heme-binding domain-containing protein